MKNEDRKILIKKMNSEKKQKTIKPYFKRERKKAKGNRPSSFTMLPL